MVAKLYDIYCDIKYANLYPVNLPNAVGIGNNKNLARLVVYLGLLITLLI